MSSIEKQAQYPIDTWPLQPGLQLMAESGEGGRGRAGAEVWITAVDSYMSVATLPLIMITGSIVLLNVLCLMWNISFFLNSRFMHRKADSPRPALGCRWGIETLPALDHRKIWVCADCGATTQNDAALPPADCQQRSTTRQPVAPPEGFGAVLSHATQGR